MRKRTRTTQDGIFDVNMTPLIDVSLVLVVILMVATPLAFQSSIALRTAARSGRQADRGRRRARRAGRAGGRTRAGGPGSGRSAASWRPRWGRCSGRVPRGWWSSDCDDGVPLGEFVGVVDEARALGAARIAVMER